MTTLRLDYETASEADLKKVGLDVYSAHPSTRILMAAYQFNKGPVRHWDTADTTVMPAELQDALADPHVVKKAFNAQFERVITRRVAKIKTPYTGWRCTMVLAYMHSFVGGLLEVGTQMGIPATSLKSKEGDRLIKLFSVPQKVTSKNPYRWRDATTDPDDWESFCRYNVQDVVAEGRIDDLLAPFPILDSEWELYELDQLINDRGLPIDMGFVENAIWMADRRKAELVEELRDLTGLANPNSTAQILPWLQDRGYPFGDLKKDTVSKVLRESAENDIEAEAVEALRLRQNASRTSVAKYDAMVAATGPSNRFRFSLQFGGASRTNRWAGRRLQAQNLPRTPKAIEPDGHDISKLRLTTELIRQGDYDGLRLMIGEPMDALVGCIRSAIRAPDGYTFRVCDLSSIETCVIAWLAGCERLLAVIRGGKDPYKDFATVLYGVVYDEVTKAMRSNSKPAVLGSGYRLGGGDLKDGKRTGLWGYAESMGVDMSRDDAHKATMLFRDTYHEIPELWYALERAVESCLRTGNSTRCGPLVFLKKGPYLLVRLPSGRHMYYFKPRIIYVTPPWGGDKRKNFSYMAQPQGTKQWVRITSHGGKLCLAKGTLVLTRQGWAAIEEIRAGTDVWDGEQWVSCDGHVYNGDKPVIELSGVKMTPDHEVLTDEGWKTALQSQGHQRAESRLPDGPGVRWERWSEVPVAGEVRLWGNPQDASERAAEAAETRGSGFVRVPPRAEHLQPADRARNVGSPDVLGVAVDAGPLPAPNAPSLGELRRAGDSRVQEMAGVVRGILRGHGSDVHAGADAGADGQQRKLRAGELHLGELQDADEQQADIRADRREDRSAACGGVRPEQVDDLVSVQPWLAIGRAAPAAREPEAVYDLINCGPNNRFVVRDSNGMPLIVHNCENFVQAIARDILKAGLLEAHRAGFNIVGHVHDEIITLHPAEDRVHDVAGLRACMTKPIPGMEGMPLGAAGWEGSFYMKD